MKYRILHVSSYCKCLYRFILFALLPICFSECKSDISGWKSIQMENDLISLQVVPAIGGRVLQYKLGDYEFFYVNKNLYKKSPPLSGLGEGNAWLNYGGDKLWLAPQGWDNDQQWPGPPDSTLDGQSYALEIINPNIIRLTSKEDHRSGVQLSRTIKLFDGTTRVSIDATMKNIDTKPRRWGIWDHTQFNASNRHGEGYNQHFWAYCPLNKNSIFPNGYEVLHGLTNNISYKPDYNSSMMKVQYKHNVGKIGIDCSAGWIATINAEDGYVFVHRFEYEQYKPYPDNSSVTIWMNGLGKINAWGKIIQMPEHPKDNPFVLESEIISPYATIKPGQEYSFHYDWYSARIDQGLGIIDCNSFGVICEPLAVGIKGATLNITGKFGFFYDGTISISAKYKDGSPEKVLTSPIEISPLERLNLNLKIEGLTNLSAIETVSISLFDKKKKVIGDFTSTELTKD